MEVVHVSPTTVCVSHSHLLFVCLTITYCLCVSLSPTVCVSHSHSIDDFAVDHKGQKHRGTSLLTHERESALDTNLNYWCQLIPSQLNREGQEVAMKPFVKRI